MNVTFACAQCEQPARTSLSADTAAISCPHCQSQSSVPRGAVEGQQLRRCVVCPSIDLYARKDFPQRLGVTLVVIGFAASCVTWYYHQLFWTFAILFATAGVDVLLYAVCGEALQCYGCGAIYRGVAQVADHPVFSLDVHERHRQQAAREAGMRG